MSDIHVDTTSSQVFLSSFVYTPAYTCTIHQHHYDVDMVAERCVFGDIR